MSYVAYYNHFSLGYHFQVLPCEAGPSTGAHWRNKHSGFESNSVWRLPVPETPAAVQQKEPCYIEYFVNWTSPSTFLYLPFNPSSLWERHYVGFETNSIWMLPTFANFEAAC